MMPPPANAPDDAVIAEKAAIRTAALARRDGLDPDLRRSASQAFAERGKEVLGPVDDRIVSGFWPIRSELDPRWLMRGLAEAGAKLALPCIEGGALVFRAFAFGDRLKRAGFGLSEPYAEAAPVIPDIMLVPLAAFDRKGGRIGYGKGYYDGAIGRFGASGKRPRLLGLAFACQEVPAVPVLAHDQRLEAILTERELIACRMEADTRGG
jgi:5-formyltetrahydrofolate cyclo-ligase